MSFFIDQLKRELTGTTTIEMTEQLERGLLYAPDAITMIGYLRLDNLQYCVEEVLKENIPGDLIETGVWKGGAVIFMATLLKIHGATNRKVFVADSFEGLPKPIYKQDLGDTHYLMQHLRVTEAEVRKNFEDYGVMGENIVFLPGWFKDTLPEAPITDLSVLRLDGDMYGSTMDALKYLYPRLSPGGFCIIDDFGLGGCQRAVMEYRDRMNIVEQIQQIDDFGVYWRKDA